MLLQAVPLDDIFPEHTPPPATTTRQPPAAPSSKRSDPMLKPIAVEELPQAEPMLLKQAPASGETYNSVSNDTIMDKLEEIKTLINQKQTVHIPWLFYVFAIVYAVGLAAAVYFVIAS